MFLVTSSPRVPLPLVTALTSMPLRYSRERADPSSFGCTMNLFVDAVVTFTKCEISLLVVALSRLNIGCSCTTLTEPGGGSAPTADN